MLVAALLAQTLVSSPPGPRLDVNWTETSVADFHDGVFDPSMYASPRALLDPDSGCVEFFARFDVDNNGYFDLACADDSGPYLRIYLGSDSGYFPANCRLYPAPGGGNVDLADLDLDGRAELVHSGWRSGHVTIYWGTDSGPSMSDTTWLQISGQSEAVAVYDLDRDSYLDILAGSDNGNIYIFWGSAAGYSSARRTSVFLNGSVGHNLEVADFDRDGYGDIAASLWSRNRSAVVYWGPGRAPRTIAWLNVSANNPHGITVADLNVDGWLDIVYTGYDTVTTAYIYYGSATGFSVGNRELIHPGQCYGGGAAVAWNADKTLDLVFFRGNWNDTATWRPRVFFNRLDTTPHFSDARYIEVGDLAFNASGGFAADLNSDGYLDLFVNNMRPDTQSYILWGPTFLSYTGLPADRDHHGVWREPGSIYTRDFDAAYVSSVYDVGQDSVLGDGSCSWTALEPPGSSIGIAVRAGNTPAPDSTWTDFFGVIMNGGPLPYPVIGKRYLQYQATFIYNRPCYLPHLERISFDLYRTPAVDVAVTGILAPTGRVDSGSVVAPAVVVRNNRLGTPVASVTMRIGPAYSHALSETLGPGQTDTVFFPAWTASPLGTHAVRCSVFAELDENRANDTLGTTVEVVAVSDVGPVAIISPPALAESGSVHTPAVTVTNFGIRTETFPVHLWIGTGYHQLVADTLLPGQSDTVSFPTWTASPPGTFSVRCSTALTRDDSTHNDTISRSVGIFTRVDAATIAVLAPTDTVDSGSVIVPRARVANNGTSTALIPCRFRIGSGYEQDSAFLVQPAETVTVAFPDWTASPLGTHPVSCSTMLAGDTFPANDRRTGSVTVVAHRDAYSVAIIAPAGIIDSGTAVVPVCRIGNDGTSGSDIPVRLRIGTAYDQTASKYVAAGATDTVHFPAWTAAPVGPVAVRCSTALAEDEDNSNDTISSWVDVGVRTDAATLAITAPVGRVDSGAVVTPVCSIANLSTRPQLVPVTLTVTNGYSQTRTKLMMIGAMDTVAFPAWTATPSGTFTVTCSTHLAGDTFPENDTVRATVDVSPRVDAELTAILAPTGAVDSGALIIPSVAVTNRGTRTADIPIRLLIGTGYSSSSSTTLAPGRTDTVYMAEWDAQPVGAHQVMALTRLAGDEDPTNDTAWTTVTVVRRVDAASVAIVAPVGDVDSGTTVTPRIRIANYGTSAADVPVQLRIGSGYYDTVVTSLPAGESAVVAFADWVATPVGSHAVRCSTALSGDETPANDTLSGLVRVTTRIDAATIAVLAPTDTVDSGSVIVPRARVANLGINAADVPVRLRIGSGYDVTDTFTVAAGETALVSFTSWTALPLGIHAVRCSTMLAGDTLAGNDLATDTVVVVARHDAWAVAIVSPSGTIDSGTAVVPVCRIGNSGTSQALVPARLRIGSGYSQTSSKLLAPGATDTVHFPVWTAQPVGLVPLQCSTAMAGDENNANDTVSSTIRVGTRIDAAAVSVLSPSGIVDTGTVITPRARVANYGLNDADVPVRLRIGSGYTAWDTFHVASGETATVAFPDWTASPVGTFAVTCTTALAGDTWPPNDTASTTVQVVPIVDAELTAILAPTGNVDSGTAITPAVTVTNNGSRTEDIPVRLVIGATYNQTSSITVGPGRTDTLYLADWIAQPVGTHDVTANTWLTGDRNHANDTARTTVTVSRRIDAASITILAPTGTVDSGTVVTPSARVANLGTSAADIPVRLTIGTGYDVTDTFPVAAGESAVVAFADWIAAPVGLLAVRCSTTLAGDTNNSNDLALDSVLVVTHVNAATLLVVAPTGSLDSGTVVTPACVVANYSTGPKVVPVRMDIGSDYRDTSSALLAPGTADTVRFSDWTATPLGTHMVVCSTALAGDENPDDDRVVDSVLVVSEIDAAAIAIIAPRDTVDSGVAVIPQAVVANLGTSPASIPVAMRIGTGYSATDTVALMPDSSVVVSFAVWNAEPVGTHAVVCSTALPGDVHPENDTALALTFVRPEVDASPTFILRPAGAVDSGTIVTPLVQVLNRSSHPQDIPVLLAIGAGYADTVTISLAAGQSDTVRFREWVAGPPGAIPVRCSTALVGDLHPANDTLSSTVVVSRTIDAAAVAILLPGDSVEYGAVLTPEAAVANLGTSRARIPVVLTIGSGYADTAQADVAPAETVVVAFASWTALEAGLLAIRCTTALPADTNSANDFVDDSVLVFLRTDAAAVAVLTPSGRVDSGTVVTPVCLVANNSSSQRLVPVRLDIGNGYSDTTFKSLGPHQTDTVAFIDWLASPLGAHAVRCSTMLEGDEVPENDTCGTVVEVAAVIDAAAVSILAPTGTVDSGSVIVPQALVANRGTRPAFVPVHLAVETGYEDSTAVLLAPDSSAVVSFQAWTAGAVGTFRVRCSTGLVGDSTPENDTISTSVTVANRHDVACCLVLSPTGTVDSGSVVTPRALVANRGNLTEDVPVVCRVAPAYCDTSLVTVQPGESVEVLFADWVAGPVGWLNVRCSTALGSDTTTGNDLAVDSVLVVSHPDAAVTDIYAPLGRVDSGSVITPLARVCNYGTSPAVVPVRMRIGAGYDEMRYKYLGVGAKDTVEFPAWASSPLGWVVISCSTALAGDERPANDRRQDSVMVVATVDVGVDAVLAPTGAVDSGTSVIPAAVVSNYGTSGALVPVRLRIAPDYDSVIMTDVAPGSSDTIFFPFWLASPVDLWPVRCSTELSGDHNNCNDRQVAEVRVGVRRDVACVTINAPPVATESGTVIIPEAVIANHGTSPAEIPLFVRIGSDYLRSRRKLLSPGGRDTVQFPAWSAHPRGDVAVACSVALAGDEVPKNNAIHQSVYVHHQLDGAVCAILVPLGPVDSGHQVVPKARVANHGIGTLGIPVEMRIGGFYRSVRTKILAPGTEDSIHFDVWSADQVGLHAVRCTSSLDGDCNPANDCRDGWTDVAWRDAGCISILEPAEVSRAGDTVVPRARVRNFGSRAERIPAVFRAGPLYARLRYADSLPPGDSVDISYPELIIGQGTTIVSCSAALHGDMHAANNKLERAVYGTCRELLLEPDTAATAPPAGIVNYRLVCRNTGNAGDTVDVTSLGSRPGWNIELLDSAGLVPLGDHNANGVPDLGLVPSGSAVPLVARVTVPANELGLVTDSTSIQATSGADPRTWDRARVATTVTAVVDLMIEPDQFNFAPPGIPHTYAFDVTNLGNVEDFADLSLSTVKGDWLHELLDAGGKSLGDRNSNGRQDIGPVPPRGGTVELRLQVTPDRWARIGQQDTSGVTIQSFADESVRDQAFAVTEIDGSVSSLSVEPDQTSTVDVGGCRDLALWVETVGNIREVVNVAASGLREGWSLQLLDESAARELGDTDGDGQPDLGYVWPAARTPFTARVTAPTCAGLVGSCDSLSARLVLTATLAGNRDLRDSATIVIQARPRFEAHNVANPFSDRTRFFLSTPGRGRMSLLVYTRLGELVRRLLDGSVCGPGVCAVDWDGTNDGGRRLAPGVYFYLFEFLADAGPDQRVLKKAVLKR